MSTADRTSSSTGLALCLAADIRIYSAAATFGNAAILLGLSGAKMGMSYLLPRIVGAGVAADWMLIGRTVSAQEADRRGLVSELVEPDGLIERALDIASRIAQLVGTRSCHVRPASWRECILNFRECHYSNAESTGGRISATRALQRYWILV
jgi:enoyl-CoA hydratase/carnithine racemase